MRVAGKDVPGAFGRPPDGVVGFSVAIEITGYRDIAGQAPLLHYGGTGAAEGDVPIALGGSPDGEVDLVVTIEIGCHRNVIRQSPCLMTGCARLLAGRMYQVPSEGR